LDHLKDRCAHFKILFPETPQGYNSHNELNIARSLIS
jgi:hypothetical protein